MRRYQVHNLISTFIQFSIKQINVIQEQVSGKDSLVTHLLSYCLTASC